MEEGEGDQDQDLDSGDEETILEEGLPLGLGGLGQLVGLAETATAGWRYPLGWGKSPIGGFGFWTLVMTWVILRRSSHWKE